MATQYKYLFGPVPSRRLGISLGVDLVPKKVCSLDCVYCEVGRTTTLTADREEYVDVSRIKEELLHYFEHHPDPDYITFSGSGEPTLNIKLNEVIDLIKSLKPHIPVAVLTNGTLFSVPEVRDLLMGADLVLPSLDAATEAAFKRINRPAEGITVAKHIQGLIDFSRDFKGKIWLEVFILPGYNDHESELLKLKEVIQRIAPDSVQLNTLDRPGVLSGLHSAGNGLLQKIIDFWGLEHVEIISKVAQRKSVHSYKADIEETIVETIARRPCTLEDLITILGIHVNELNKYLAQLEDDQTIETIEGPRGTFYQLKGR